MKTPLQGKKNGVQQEKTPSSIALAAAAAPASSTKTTKFDEQYVDRFYHAALVREELPPTFPNKSSVV